MTVDPLRIFVQVAEQKNFTRAAEILHLSQPAVSQHIQGLENDFGVKLLHRTSKQVKLTTAGEILYERARKILLLYEEAKEEINLLQNEVKGSLKIGASFTIGEYVLPRILAEYAQQYPFVEMDVKIGNTDEITQAVRLNQIEVGLIEGNIEAKDLNVEPFMQDEMIFILPTDHPLTMQRSVRLEELQDQIWIFRESGSGTRTFSDRFIEQNDVRVKRSYVFSSSQGVKEAVTAGLGISLVSRWIVRRELLSGQLATLNLHDVHLYRRCSIIMKQATTVTKAMDVFLKKTTSYQQI